MGTHRITLPDTTWFDFELWDGPPPPLLPYASMSFSRPGVNGHGLQVMGRRQEPVSVQLSEDFNSFAAAVAFAPNYDLLPSVGACDVIYNSIAYTAFDVQYLVTDPMIVSIQRHVNLCGPGYSYPGGARIVLSLKLLGVPRV